MGSPPSSGRDETDLLLEELEQLLAGDASATAGAIYIALHRGGPATPTELSARLDIPQSTASHAAKSLVREGVVTEEKNLADARSTVYAPAPPSP